MNLIETMGVEMFSFKVHSFLSQCFARSSVGIFWWYFQLMLACKSAESTTRLCQLKIVQNTFLKINGLKQSFRVVLHIIIY